MTRTSDFIDDLGSISPIPKHAKEVFVGHVYSVWQWDQKLYDGSSGTYEGLKRPDTSHIVGVTPDKQILLTEDTQPNRGPVLTPPGGQIEEGESPAEAAERELLEETGYKAGEIVPWHHYRAHTKIDWTIYAFIGRNMELVTDAAPEPGEKITVRLFSFDEFLELGHNVNFRDRIIRNMLLAALLDPAKKEELKALLYGE